MEVTPMTEMMSGVDDTENAGDANAEVGTPGLDGLDEQLVSQLVDRAKAGGLQLTGEAVSCSS
jgi:putative transposase